MAFIEWGVKYSVGIPLIDAQHKKLFEIINTYHDSGMSTDSAFEGLISYIEFHFKTEEYYFEKFNYVLTKEHEESHKYYQDKILQMHELYLKERVKDSIRHDLEVFVRDWISGHIMMDDVMYRKCFFENGLGSYEPKVTDIEIDKK